MREIVAFLMLIFLLTGCSPKEAEKTSVEDYSDVWEAEEDESEEVEDVEENQYVGSIKSNIYHIPNCSWVKNIKKENEIRFDSKEEATSRGYRGCYTCM